MNKITCAFWLLEPSPNHRLSQLPPNYPAIGFNSNQNHVNIRKITPLKWKYFPRLKTE